MNTQQLEDASNEALAQVNRMFAKMLPSSPSYRYYSHKKDRYFWTTEKIKHGQGRKYVAGIYRFLKTKNQLKLVKRVGFSKRYKAKAWANKEYLKSKQDKVQ